MDRWFVVLLALFVGLGNAVLLLWWWVVSLLYPVVGKHGFVVWTDSIGELPTEIILLVAEVALIVAAIGIVVHHVSNAK